MVLFPEQVANLDLARRYRPTNRMSGSDAWGRWVGHCLLIMTWSYCEGDGAHIACVPNTATSFGPRTALIHHKGNQPSAPAPQWKKMPIRAPRMGARVKRRKNF
jgi:hypothetical protein